DLFGRNVSGADLARVLPGDPRLAAHDLCHRGAAPVDGRWLLAARGDGRARVAGLRRVGLRAHVGEGAPVAPARPARPASRVDHVRLVAWTAGVPARTPRGSRYLKPRWDSLRSKGFRAPRWTRSPSGPASP